MIFALINREIKMPAADEELAKRRLRGGGRDVNDMHVALGVAVVMGLAVLAAHNQVNVSERDVCSHCNIAN